eukprot:6145510-Amphidinium_carterae.1
MTWRVTERGTLSTEMGSKEMVQLKNWSFAGASVESVPCGCTGVGCIHQRRRKPEQAGQI